MIGRYLSPIICNSFGHIYAITIVFKPLGLNYFVDNNLGEIYGSVFQPLNEWTHHTDTLQSILKERKSTKIINMIDDFLLSIMKPFNQPTLEKAVALLSSHSDNIDVNKIEKILNVNRKTLQRLFVKHLALNPVTFKRIARFRNTLDLCKNEDEILTTIAYKNNFSDQSHLIKDFKKLTGNSPKEFLRAAIYKNGSPFLMKFSKY